MAKLIYHPKLIILVSLIICSSVFGTPLSKFNNTEGSNNPFDEAAAVRYLEELEPRYSSECNKEMTSRWRYITDVTKENEEASVDALNKYLAFQAAIQKEINDKFPDWRTYATPAVKREFQFLASMGPSTMDPKHVAEMNSLGAAMESSYAEAKVCKYGSNPVNCTPDLSLEPELEEKLRTATDFDELDYYWTAWHDKVSGQVSTATYKKFIDFQNELAVANGYGNMGDLWAGPYDDGSLGWTAKEFEQQMLDIWEELRPSYNKLHAYVRMKLRQNPLYADKIDKYGTLPANLLGNMWAQDWTALDSSTKPYPEAPSLDATNAMIKKGYTVKKMFEVSNEFFTGLGLAPMTQKFWDGSMIEKPTDREVVCHASAEDFCLGKGNEDFRIKMCTNVDQDDLVTVHHEMGHIAYFMEYTNEHFIFRDGANPGFHEAIGDALALAVTTPKHLQCVLELDLGLDVCNDDSTKIDGVTETDINFLYLMALQKFSFFPFAISMDSWRWGVFNGSIPESEYNSKWWEIRKNNQGISPSSPRNLTSAGLDAAAKYHIVGNVEYIRYFISHILQFQFYEHMCIAAGEYNSSDANSKPLYQCDFAGSKDAGKKFGDMMKLGFKEPWPVALKTLTGSEKMDIGSLVKYFEPLFQYIDKELAANGERPGFSGYTQEYQLGNFYQKKDEESANLNGIQNPIVKETADADASSSSSTEEAKKEDDDEGDNLAAIIVGIILAIIVVVILFGYLLSNKCCKKS